MCAVALRAIMAFRGSRSIAVVNRNIDTRWRWVVNFLFTPGKDTRKALNCRLCWASDPVSTISEEEKKNICSDGDLNPGFFSL